MLRYGRLCKVVFLSARVLAFRAGLMSKFLRSSSIPSCICNHQVISKRKDLEMIEHKTIHLKTWNNETSRNEDTVEALNVYNLAKSLSPDNFAALIDDYLNLGGKGY